MRGADGPARYAEVTHDVRVMEFVREGYEYLRNFGIARIGLFGEMCNVGDMTYLAVRLSRLGVGDYWDDVDQYVRNQLAEGQVTDVEKLQRAAAASPILARIDPKHDVGVQQPLQPGQQQVAIDPIRGDRRQRLRAFRRGLSDRQQLARMRAASALHDGHLLHGKRGDGALRGLGRRRGV